jgi:hypothetical protein
VQHVRIEAHGEEPPAVPGAILTAAPERKHVLALLDVTQFVHLEPPTPEVWLSEREIAAICALEMRVEPDASKARIPLWRRLLHRAPPLPFE